MERQALQLGNEAFSQTHYVHIFTVALYRTVSLYCTSNVCVCVVCIHLYCDMMVLTTLLLGIFSAMSTNLSPQQVVKALEVLTNDETTELVFRLGVSLHVLNDIEKGRIYKIRAIQAWLDKDTGASWEKIISGLREIKKDVLAKEVAKQHCPQSPYVATPSSDPSQPASVLTTQPVTTPAPVTPAIPSSVATTSADDSEQSPNTATSDCTQSLAVDMRNVANVKATIRHLEKTFLNLISRTRSALCRKESQDREFLENFRDYLLILPVAQKAAHVKFFRESEDDILRARDIRKLFAILSRYWSYRNYEILRNIIYFFCENLQEGMQDYCRILEEFEKATTIDIYLTAISASQELSVAFIKMAVKINKPASLCTLHEVRKLKDALAEKASLHSYSTYVESMSESSVVLVLRFPKSCVGWIVAALTCKFLQEHLLSDVVVNGRKLTTLVAPQQELVSMCTIQQPVGKVLFSDDGVLRLKEFCL